MEKESLDTVQANQETAECSKEPAQDVEWKVMPLHPFAHSIHSARQEEQDFRSFKSSSSARRPSSKQVQRENTGLGPPLSNHLSRTRML